MHVLLPVLTALTLGSATLFGAPRKLVVDAARSKVTFAVDATMHSFVGTVETWTADVTLPENSDLPDHATFSAPITALRTGNDSRDRDLREWMQSGDFPTIEFRLDKIEDTPQGRRATGDLTIHGITRKITMPVTLERSGERLTIAGTASIDHRDFDLKPIRKFLFLTVSPNVEVKFNLTGTLQ